MGNFLDWSSIWTPSTYGSEWFYDSSTTQWNLLTHLFLSLFNFFRSILTTAGTTEDISILEFLVSGIQHMLHINTSTRTKCLTCHMSRFLAVCRTALYVVLHCEDHIQTITTTSSDLACLDLFPLVNSSTLNFFSIPCQLPCMLILYVTHSCLTLYDLNSL